MANSGINIIKVQVDGQKLKSQIKNHGYSIRSLSQKIGCNERTIRDYIKRDYLPMKIADEINKTFNGDATYRAICIKGYPMTSYDAMKKQFLENYALEMDAKCQEHDNVNHPGHYTFGEIEVIDYIRDKMTPDEFQGYCMGNVLKYVSRHKHKNGVEDLKKAQVYLGWMIESEEKGHE